VGPVFQQLCWSLGSVVFKLSTLGAIFKLSALGTILKLSTLGTIVELCTVGFLLFRAFGLLVKLCRTVATLVQLGSVGLVFIFRTLGFVVQLPALVAILVGSIFKRRSMGTVVQLFSAVELLFFRLRCTIPISFELVVSIRVRSSLPRPVRICICPYLQLGECLLFCSSSPNYIVAGMLGYMLREERLSIRSRALRQPEGSRLYLQHLRPD
jgi:hypothetical protein